MELEDLKKGSEEFAKEFIRHLKEELISAGKNNTGNLINSLAYNVYESGESVLIEIKSDDYLENVDKGRKPGSKMPPPNKLVGWVESKGIKIGKTPEQTAFVIAKSIGQKGIKPTNVLDKTKDYMLQSRLDILEKASVHNITDMIKKIVSK